MAEIVTPVRVFTDEEGEEHAIIGPEHTLSDIARWLLRSPADAEEMVCLLQGGLGD